MATLTLEQAVRIADATLKRGRAAGYKPLTVAVLDAGGNVKALHRDDGSDILRPDIATGKAWGALGMGMSSRALGDLAAERPQFVASLAALAAGRVVPAAGGVLLRTEDGAVIGAVGVSGDVSDNDEECALAGVKAAGLTVV